MASLKEILDQKKKQRESEKASSIRTLKPVSGKHVYRILPGWSAADRATFWHDFGMHFIKDTPNGKPVAAYVCLEKTFKRPCGVCAQLSAAISRTTDDDQVKLLQEAKAGQKYLLNVLHLTGDKPNEVQVLEIGNKVFDALIAIAEEYAGDEGDRAFFDLKDGLDITITKEGSGLNTDYQVMPSMKKSNPVPETVLERLHNLEAIVSQENEVKLQNALNKLGVVSGVMAPTAGAALPPGRGRLSLEDIDAELVGGDEVSAAPADNAGVDDLDALLDELDETGT